jgi:hypothetical protein
MSNAPEKNSSPVADNAPAAEAAVPVDPATLFSKEWATATFSPERTDAFFKAMYGNAEEGAYNISLRFVRAVEDSYEFALDLHQRPGKCLACNLTYGLPQVFSRHPVINLRSIAHTVASALGREPETVLWKLKPTQETSSTLHSVPLVITFTV